MGKIKMPDDVVIFQDSNGNEISNDPRFHAIKTLENSGVSFENSQPEQLAQAATNSGVEKAEGPKDYKALDAKALKAEAKERGIETKGMTRVSELRDALAADDAEKAAQVEVENANSTEDEELEEDEDSEGEESED